MTDDEIKRVAESITVRAFFAATECALYGREFKEARDTTIKIVTDAMRRARDDKPKPQLTLVKDQPPPSGPSIMNPDEKWPNGVVES